MHKLKLVIVGKHKIQVVKLIHMFTQLGLKESKELMDNAPSILISHREDISLEQIIKNFAAIGAIVEKVQEETKDNPKDETIGPDEFYSTQRPGIAKHKIKNYQKENNGTKTENNKNTDYQPNNNQKLKLKPAIIFAIIVAVIKSLINIYLGYIASFFAIFIVALGIAYLLRKHNEAADKKLGSAAFLMTLAYFFASRIIDAIILYALYQYVTPLNIFGLLVSLFTSRNFLVLLAALMAYFLANNKFIFKRFYENSNKTKSDSDNFMENKQIKYPQEKKRF